MSFDFNKKGQKFGFVAAANDKSNFGVLGIEAVKYFCELQNTISKTHQHGDAKQKRLMVGAQGCLERLEAFLVQSQRLSEHNNRVCQQEAPPPGNMAAFRDTTAIFDFETLLFHARALLDRTTFFIAKQIYNQDCDRPNKLKNVLENFCEKDHRATSAIILLDETIPKFSGLIIDSEKGKSLRSHLIHKSTSGENTTCAFTIHTSPQSQVIRFDHEIKTYPLIGSAWVLSNYVPYFVINSLAIYLNFKVGITLDECRPLWKNQLVCFSQQIDPSGNGPKFSIVKMHPSGFEIISRNLNPSILSEEKM